MVPADALDGETGVAHDADQQVVKVVGDAAGQQAEAFQLVLLQEEALEFLAMGDVAGDDAEEAAAGGFHAGSGDFELAAAAAGAEAHAFEAGGRAGCGRGG